MRELLNRYEKGANNLSAAIEKEPAGDHRAWLQRVVEYVRKELTLATNMIEEKKPARDVYKVFDRIDQAFNRIK
jgi:hypothetical protein